VRHVAGVRIKGAENMKAGFKMRVFECLVIIVVPLSIFAAGKLQHHAAKVPSRYMIQLNAAIPEEALDSVMDSIAASYHFDVAAKWRKSRRVFVGVGLTTENATRLANDGRIALVEEDYYVAPPTVSASTVTWWNNNYLWHLDRIDQRYDYVDPSTHTMDYNWRPAADDIVVYLIDTGVHTEHEQLTTRGITQYRFDADDSIGNADTETCVSANWAGGFPTHGTWTASVVTGSTIGASTARVVSLRVASCPDVQGSYTILGSHVAQALDWIRSGGDPNSSSPAVVSMSVFKAKFGSLLSENYPLVEAAADRLFSDPQQPARSLPIFVSANNFGTDACQFAPADRAYTNASKTGSVFTVGGTSLGGCDPSTGLCDLHDYRWQSWNADGTIHLEQDYGSNGGDCISIYAPAADIFVANPPQPSSAFGGTLTDSYVRLSGTSFSAPLTAAVAARYTKEYMNTYGGARPSPTQVYEFLLSNATPNVVDHVATPASWWCASSYHYYGYTSNPGVCPVGYQRDGTTPLAMPATDNTRSNAGMLYYNPLP
jgi:hypothetical protein